MELSQPLAGRAGNAAAAATAVHSSPSIGQLAILTNGIPSLVHAHRQSLLGYGAVSHTTTATNPCPYLAAAGYGHGTSTSTGSSSGVVTGSTYPLPRHHQTSLHNCTNDRSHMYSYLGSSGSPTSGNNGQLILSSAPLSCTARHQQYQLDTLSSNTPTISNPPSARTSSYYDAAPCAIDMSLLQAAAAAAVTSGSSPPSGVSRNNNFSGRLMLDQLETTADQNRQFHQNQQQALSTHARRTALSAATAALHDPTGRLLSPPLSVEELALDASTLEQALGNNSNSSVRLFNPFDNDETLLQQDARREPEVLNPEAPSSSNMSPSVPLGNSGTANLGAVSFSNVTVTGTNSTVRNGRAVAPRKTNTRSSTRALKAQERKTTGTKRGSQLEAPQETVGRSRRSRTTTTSLTLDPGMPTSGPSSKTPDPIVSNSSLPPANMTTEDKKKPAVKKNKKEEKLINPPSIIKAEEESICCICMDVCVKCELASINSCKHKFCFSCIEKWADRENTCPLCKERFTKIERVHKPPSRKRKSDNSSATPPRQRNTKRVKNRSQRSDFISSNAFQGLLASMQSGPFPDSVTQFIFSSIPTRNRPNIVSLTRGSAPSRPVVGSGSARVFSAAGSDPFTDLTISPTHSSTNNATQQGSTRPASTASAAGGLVQGALEVHRVHNFEGNGGGLQNHMTFRHPDFFLPNGPRNRLRSSRRLVGPVVIDSDAESDEDVEEMSMFIRHFRSMANRDALASSAQSFYAGPPAEQVRTRGPMNNVSSLSYGIASRSTPPRSYATNVHERGAGATADTALEILDSDDDDDVIEILMRAQA